MKPHVDMNKIALGLRAERKGHVSAGGGYFGAMQLLAAGPIGARTLKRLEAITEGVKARSGVRVEPMQLAALLLEKTTEQLNEDEVKDLVTVRRRASR